MEKKNKKTTIIKVINWIQKIKKEKKPSKN